MPDQIWKEGRSVFITSFWGWTPETWGTVGFASSGRRDTILRTTTDPFIVVIYITKTAPGADRSLRGIITGFYLVSHIKGDRHDFTDTTHHGRHPNKWQFSLKALRAFSFMPDHRLSIDDFDPSIASRGQAVGTHGEELSAAQVEQLKAIPYEEVPVFGGNAIGGGNKIGGRTLDRNVLFARIGRMHNYAGSTDDDPRPIGGGGYNKKRKGGELNNFKRIGQKMYGYFQPNMRSQSVALERINPSAKGQKLKNVLVIFVAPSEQHGQTVVGWYRNATVYRVAQPTQQWKLRGNHLVSANWDECTLIPYDQRKRRVPHGKGAMGQTNACYPLESNGSPKNASWMQEIIRYVDDYERSNLISEPEAGADDEAAAAAERAIARSKGQGFPKSAEQRRAIELHAMRAAKLYFERIGYVVEDVSARRSYDYLCKKGRGELHVEVKGTMTDGETIVLTRKEVEHACHKANTCALFVLYSIKLQGNKASGGENKVFHPWALQPQALKPISFTYQVD